MTPGELTSAVVAAIREAVEDGELDVPVPARVPVSGTPDGAYATPVAFRLAGAAGRPAGEVAEVIVRRLAERPGIGTARVTGGGFVTVASDVPLTARIDESYGLTELPAGEPAWPIRPLTFDNPGFAVRFAYARACGVRRQAADLGIHEAEENALDDPRERRLLALLADFPCRAEQAARQGDRRPFVRHLELTAGAYHDVHEWCPALPKGDEPASARHAARLSLARAVRVVVGNGLRMLGETPGDRL